MFKEMCLCDLAGSLKPGEYFGVYKDNDNLVKITSIGQIAERPEKMIDPVEFYPFEITKAKQMRFDGTSDFAVLSLDQYGRVYSQIDDNTMPVREDNVLVVGTEDYVSGFFVPCVNNPDTYKNASDLFSYIGNHMEVEKYLTPIDAAVDYFDDLYTL